MNDTLANRIDRLRERASRVRLDEASAGRFPIQIGLGLGWLRRRVVAPAWRLARRPALWTFRQYRRLWAIVVYRRVDGELAFSAPRAGLMILATAIVAWFALIPALGLTIDVAFYLATVRRDEELWLFGSQEIDPSSNAHNVEGVERLPWSDHEAIYFRTEDTLFNNMWSLAHGRGLYFPEYVAAAVPYAITKCSATSYGVRIRFLMRYVNIYPKLLTVRCDVRQ